MKEAKRGERHDPSLLDVWFDRGLDVRARRVVLHGAAQAASSEADETGVGEGMRLLSLLGIAAFTLASVVVGIRLLRLWRRTRQLPELAMGLSFTVCGAIGFPLEMAGRIVSNAGDAATAYVLSSSAVAVLGLGFVALAIGTWQIYRPASRVAAGSVAGIACALLLAWLAEARATDATPGGLGEIAHWSGMLLGAGVFGWASIEAFSLYASLRRRARIGLASPEVVNRVLLWGIGSGASWLMPLNGVAARVLEGPVISPGTQLITSMIGLVAAVSTWLAFFPPAAYRARFAAATPAAQA